MTRPEQHVANGNETERALPAAATNVVPSEQLRARLAERLERLSGERLSITADALALADGDEAVSSEDEERRRTLQRRIRLFGQLASGLSDVLPDALPVAAAGYGSTVTVEDLDDGSREAYTLVTGQLVDSDAGQVSLASPIGQALLGRSVGETVEIRTPRRRRRLRIVEFRTIHDRLAEEAPVPAARATADIGGAS